MLRLDDRLSGRFRVDEAVTEGGMGAIYRGFDLERGVPVAIKVLREGVVESATRFAREATVLAAIDHPGIVQYIAHGTSDDGAPYLVMDWVEGPTLAQRLERTGLNPPEAIALVGRIASAIAAAHARGLVHRDLKPENILLEDDDLDRPRVIDFGLARHSWDQRLTDTGMVVGTPGYMAPEQARGDRDLDPRTDVFALGCILFECLSGVPAFAGRNHAAVMARIVLCEPESLCQFWPDVPPVLDRMVNRMMAKVRDNRPADAGEVARQLAALTVPDGPRRPRAATDRQTTTPNKPSATAAYVIFIQTPEGESDTVQRVVAPFDVTCERLADGATVLVVRPDRAEVADACTDALRAAFPDRPVVRVGHDIAGGAPLASLIDEGADALELADLRDIFRGDPP